MSVPSRNGLTKPKRVRGSGVKMVNMGELFANQRIQNLEMDRVPLVEKERIALLEPNDLLFARQSLVFEGAGQCSIFLGDDEDVCFESHLIRVRIDPVKADPRYIFYWLLSPAGKNAISSKVEQGAGAAGIRGSDLQKVKIELPDLEAQKKIADILGTIDEKIELNRQMNETLEQMGQALFRHYFIDNPEAEKWEDGVLGDIIVNFDSKRKPLSSRQRAEMQGEYRYFGATSVMDYVKDYLFDGKYLLLAEDGSVMKKDGTPYLQYVWGKFWVNNHAHILQAKEPFTVEYLYLLLSRADVQSLVSGAVQLKINQKAMNSFKIKLPTSTLVEEFCASIDPMFAQRRKNEEEIQTLTTLLDTLLPRLISGKVKV